MKIKDLLFPDTKDAGWKIDLVSLIGVYKRVERISLNSGAPLIWQPDNLQLELIDLAEL
jgi:hypothetical protein